MRKRLKSLLNRKPALELLQRAPIQCSRFPLDTNTRLLEQLYELGRTQPIVVHVFVARPAPPLCIREAKEVDLCNRIIGIGKVIGEIKNVEQRALGAKQAPSLAQHGHNL